MNRTCLRAALGALFLAALAVPGAFAQDGAAASYNGHSYALFEDGCSWEEARRACERMGGHLVTISSRAEQKAVAALLKSGSKKFYWAGGYRARSSHFLWLTGEKFSYTNWASDAPGDGTLGKKDSMMLYKSSGMWKDENGDRPSGKASALQGYGYICEWDGERDAAAPLPEPAAAVGQGGGPEDGGALMGMVLQAGKKIRLFAPDGASWASSDPGVAKVSRGGVLTAVSAGSAVITAEGAGSLAVRVED